MKCKPLFLPLVILFNTLSSCFCMDGEGGAKYKKEHFLIGIGMKQKLAFVLSLGQNNPIQSLPLIHVHVGSALKRLTEYFEHSFQDYKSRWDGVCYSYHVFFLSLSKTLEDPQMKIVKWLGWAVYLFIFAFSHLTCTVSQFFSFIRLLCYSYGNSIRIH